MEYYSRDIEIKLSDDNLYDAFMRAPSTIQNIKNIKKILVKYLTEEEKINDLCKDLSHMLIKPGAKGVIRGNKFNDLVFNEIKKYYPCVEKEQYPNIENFDRKKYEKPDCLIRIDNNKYICIYNQVDFWSGGAQTNRGAKYILNEEFHDIPNVKILSIICKKLESKSVRCINILKKGISTNRLCYFNAIPIIIPELIKQLSG